MVKRALLIERKDGIVFTMLSQGWAWGGRVIVKQRIRSGTGGGDGGDWVARTAEIQIVKASCFANETLRLQTCRPLLCLFR